MKLKMVALCVVLGLNNCWHCHAGVEELALANETTKTDCLSTDFDSDVNKNRSNIHDIDIYLLNFNTNGLDLVADIRSNGLYFFGPSQELLFSVRWAICDSAQLAYYEMEDILSMRSSTDPLQTTEKVGDNCSYTNIGNFSMSVFVRKNAMVYVMSRIKAIEALDISKQIDVQITSRSSE